MLLKLVAEGCFSAIAASFNKSVQTDAHGYALIAIYIPGGGDGLC